jgi:hypothetical protein
MRALEIENKHDREGKGRKPWVDGGGKSRNERTFLRVVPEVLKSGTGLTSFGNMCDCGESNFKMCCLLTFTVVEYTLGP